MTLKFIQTNGALLCHMIHHFDAIHCYNLLLKDRFMLAT